MSDLNNILNNDDELSEELLMKYASGNLSAEERHAIESKMIDSSFLSDAVEGISSMKDKKQIQQYVDELNTQLQKQVQQKKKRKAKCKYIKKICIQTYGMVSLLADLLPWY